MSDECLLSFVRLNKNLGLSSGVSKWSEVGVSGFVSYFVGDEEISSH